MSYQGNFGTALRLLAALIMLSLAALGQDAGLVGTATDASGAVMGGVRITAVNADTGVERQATTDAEGRFSISPLAIGSYTLRAEHEGFRTTTVTGVRLTIAQVGRVDVVLQVGQTTETVEVRDTATLLQAEEAGVGSSVEHKKIVDLPLDGRDFTQLVNLVPGASQAGGSYESGNSQVQIGGQRASKTMSTIDGVLNVDPLFQGFPVLPSVDAIEEFRLQSGNFSADQGMGSSNLSIRLKSGTNTLHATLFEFLRNDRMDARGFFAEDRETLKRNQFGGSAGGPVKRNKIFFFGAVEASRERSAFPQIFRVPTSGQKQGNYAGFDPITDPFSGTPFPGNQIPTSRLDGVATYFSKYYPDPNYQDILYRYNASMKGDRDQYNIRYDHYVSDKSRFFVNYSLTGHTRFDPAQLPAQGGLDRQGRAQNAGVNWNYTFNPTWMNTLVVGWSRYKNTITPTELGKNYTVESGLQGYDDTSKRFPGFPGIYFANYTGINGYEWFPLINPTDNRQVKDDVSFLLGAHHLHAGADLRRFMWSSQSATVSRGQLGYWNSYSGDSWADFQLSAPSYAMRQYPQSNYNQISYNYAFYFQDDWRVTRDLTINLGLRYQYNTWPVDTRNQITSFDPVSGKFAVGHFPGKQPDLAAQPVAQLAWQLFGSYMARAEDVGLPSRTMRFPDKNNWAPRIGIAYRPPMLKDTVVRAGYGVFYLDVLNSNNYSDFTATSIPWIITQAVNNTDPLTLTNEHLFQPLDTPGAAAPNIQPIGYAPHARYPYVQEWNFSLQRQLPHTMTLEAAYVGNKGTKLETRLPFNRPWTPGPGDVQSRRPFPSLSEGYTQSNIANSIYHSLQVRFEKMYSNGLSLVSAYTLSKSIDDSSSDYGSGVLDVRNYRLERAVSSTDHRHRFTAGYIYELPIGKGRTLLPTAGRLVDGLLGGWEMAGIVTLQSGGPFTVGINGDYANVGTYWQRPNRVASGAVSNPAIERWFDPAAFTAPADYTFGNSGRNILRGDKFMNWDASLLKNFAITERVRLQLRGEFFNVLNHPSFGGPDSALDSPTVGQVFSTSSAPRVGQVALKIMF